LNFSRFCELLAKANIPARTISCLSWTAVFSRIESKKADLRRLFHITLQPAYFFIAAAGAAAGADAAAGAEAASTAAGAEAATGAATGAGAAAGVAGF
jgi:hypothetical protein